MAVFTDHKFWWWLDIETTGSDRTKHSVIEVAWIITNPELEPLDSESVLIKPDEAVDMKVINTEVGKMHTKNGLWAEWLSAGNLRKSLGTVRAGLTDRLQALGKQPGERVLLCGSGAGRFDKPFLEAKCPGFCSSAGYYDLDVSVLRRFFDYNENKTFAGKAHRALDDCKQAIEEFRFYRDTYKGINA